MDVGGVICYRLRVCLYMYLYVFKFCYRLYVNACRTVRTSMNKVEIVVFHSVYIWTENREGERKMRVGQEISVHARKGERVCEERIKGAHEEHSRGKRKS